MQESRGETLQSVHSPVTVRISESRNSSCAVLDSRG